MPPPARKEGGEGEGKRAGGSCGACSTGSRWEMAPFSNSWNSWRPIQKLPQIPGIRKTNWKSLPLASLTPNTQARTILAVTESALQMGAEQRRGVHRRWHPEGQLLPPSVHPGKEINFLPGRDECREWGVGAGGWQPFHTGWGA